MPSTKDIIQINITRETRGVSRQGFGTPLFLGSTSAGWSGGELVRTYTSVDDVLSDFGPETPEYVAASRFFGQQISPAMIKIGRHTPGVVSITVQVDAIDEYLYTLTLGDSTIEYTSGIDATAQEVVSALQEQFSILATSGFFEDNGDGSFTIIPSDTTDYNLNTGPGLNPVENSQSLTEALSAIRAQDSDWYFVTAYTHDPEDIMEIAEYVQAMTGIYVTSYSGADATNVTVTSDPGSRLQERAFSRTVIMYVEDATEYPECAIVGLQAPKDPGSTTWKFKEVSGVTASRLSPNASLVLKGTKYDYGKGYNTYEPTGGRTIFAEGRVANGEFIDIIRFGDWLEARMRERIYLTLLNSEKIPYTSAGFGIIEGRMREVLNEGVSVGGLASYSVSVPNPRNIDPNSRANRVATGFRFRGLLQGAVHAVEIQGALEI